MSGSAARLTVIVVAAIVAAASRACPEREVADVVQVDDAGVG